MNTNNITLNAIKTLLKYTDDPDKIGGYGIDVQDEGEVVTVRIGLSYWKNGHPFDYCDDWESKYD